ncbi:hypothetical protein JKW30_000719 [Salmonella enterica]|nr:hypothetical protein [Salmonella enterica]
MNSISSPTSHASCSTSQASYPDDLINSTLVLLFYLTSDGGFMSKNGYMPCHREKDGKLQIEVITNDYSFWMASRTSVQTFQQFPDIATGKIIQ